MSVIAVAPTRGMCLQRQRGAALIAALVFFVLIGIGAVLAVARGTDSQVEKERRTQHALAQAKEALVGFAASVDLTGPERPGDLPCPDLDNDGAADPPCATESTRLGRLPWRTLGLPDLRDGDGERLWYAVSTRFKNNPRTGCANHADIDCLNSNTRGTISLRDGTGQLIHDASGPNDAGVVAVVIAPGAVIQRADSLVQTRADLAVNVANNYLDILGPTGEDNANFIDSSLNGFVAGPVVDATGRTVVNDRVLAITIQDIVPVLERRVAQEVAACLDSYAGAGRYPWAARMDFSALGNYGDDTGASQRYGRVPDPPFNRTNSDNASMANTWTAGCRLLVTFWWTNWKALVLYAVAEPFQPTSVLAACGASDCFTVSRQIGAVTNVRYVVMVAGAPLPAQTRPPGTVSADPANYVEEENVTTPSSPDTAFTAWSPTSSPYNDRLAYRP